MLVAIVTLPGTPACAMISASRRSSSGLAVSSAGFGILIMHTVTYHCNVKDASLQVRSHCVCKVRC